ncbi:S24 family peptidase [Moraxella nonliquefaciens]|uniref:S24 family peptidase n=1 Tax=Moraxella nonliquefaciens TaxID=478 RepID=UPI0034526C1F
MYALFLDGDLMIKRIFKEAGGVIRLSSDNKQYTDKIVTQDNGDSLIIIGRVVYRSG